MRQDRASRRVSFKSPLILARDSRSASNTVDYCGVQDTFFENAKSISASTTFPSAKAERSIVGTTISDFSSSEEESNRTSLYERSAETGFLLETFSSPKVEWRLPPSVGRISVESVHKLPTFPDGNCASSTSCSSTRRLELFHRFDGCIPACTDSSDIVQVSSPSTIASRGLLFQGPALWSEYQSPSIHQGSDSCSSPTTAAGASPTHLSRRLASFSGESTHSRKIDTYHSGNYQKFRFSGEQKQIQVDSSSKLRVPGFVFRHSPFNSKTCRSSDRQDLKIESRLRDSFGCLSKTIASTDRGVKLQCRLSTPGSAFSPSNSALVTPALDSEDGRHGSTSHCGSRFVTGSVSMDKSRLAKEGCKTSVPFSDSHFMHGCVQAGLGSQCEQSPSFRHLDSQRITTTHKCPGNAGNFERNSGIQCSNPFTGSVVTNRQFHLCQLCEKTGRHTFVEDVQPGLGIIPSDRGSGNKSSLPSHSFKTECSSRQSVTSSPSTHRVESSKRGVFTSETTSAHIVNRSVRNLCESPVRIVHKSLSGSKCSNDGCTVSSMEVYRHPLRISTYNTSEGSFNQDKVGTSSTNPGNCSVLASPTLVYRSDKSVCNKRNSATSPTRPTSSEALDSSQSTIVQPTRVDAIRNSLTSKGYSEHVAKRVASAGRTSTNAVYDGKWKIYTNWCQSRSYDPLSTLGPQLTEFFWYLFTEKGLTYSTLRGYKASILTVLKTIGILSTETLHVIGNLFLSFQRERPVQSKPMPNWDLGIVLQGFKTTPFEPIKKASLKLLTLKTVFLLALATGARRGELLALRRGSAVKFTEDFDEVLLHPDPLFVPKTKRGICSTRPIVVRSFKKLVGTDSEDRFLCPVRALKVYLRKTRETHILKGREKLFLPLDADSTSELTTVGLKNLLVLAIQESYKAVNAKLGSNFELKVHDLRMLTHSLANASGVSMDTILTSGRWKNKCTFTNFYLKSLARYAENLYSLGPISVAGVVVEPGCRPLC